MKPAHKLEQPDAKSPRKPTSGLMPAVKAPPPVTPIARWSEQRVLETARKRTADLQTTAAINLTTMLNTLMVEAGWEEADFIDALCQDVIMRNSLKKAGR